MSKPKPVKVIEWRLYDFDKGRLYCITFNSHEACAQYYGLSTYGGVPVRCTVTYTVPKKARKQ